MTSTGASQNIITGTSAAATLENVDNILDLSGQLGNGELTLTNDAGGIIESNGGTLILNTGSNAISNAGTIQGSIKVNSDISNSGTLKTNGGTLAALGAVTGGNAIIDGGTLEFGATSSTNVNFATNGTLKLDASSSNNGHGFTGSISGFGGADQIDLSDIGFAAGTTLGYTPNSNNSGGTLTVSDGMHTANLHCWVSIRRRASSRQATARAAR